MMEKDKLPGCRVLLVDDEPQIRRFLRAALTSQGYEVTEAGSVQEATTLARAEAPNLVILDLGLPDGDGLTVVRTLRTWTQIPILILSVRGQEADKVAALDAGADDYLTKPFGTGELLARLRAALRRTARADSNTPFESGALVIDFEGHRVTVDGQEIRLTTTEFSLLQTLSRQAGKVLTHKQLLEAVWGPGYEKEAHMLRVNISNLRRKLEPNPLQPQYVITEPGVGYRLRVVDPARDA